MTAPSTATGVESRLSIPRDCHDPMIAGVLSSILITPASSVAMYAIPNLVAISLILSESNPSDSEYVSMILLELNLLKTGAK